MSQVAVPAMETPTGNPRAPLWAVLVVGVLAVLGWMGLGPVAALPLLVVVLALLGAPLFVSLGMLTLLGMTVFSAANEGLPFQNKVAGFFLEMSDLAATPFLVAIPCFTLAGTIMSRGGISTRLVRIARALVGWMPGGLAVAAILACALFAALSGSSAVTIVAIGAIVVPALKAEGYSESFSIGLLTASGAVGILAPPSLPLIVYGVIAGVDINALFLAGVLPGLVTVLALSAYVMWKGIRGMGVRTPFRVGELLSSLRDGAFALALPLLLLGAIYSGKATVIEVSALAAVYAALVEMVVHRQVKISEFSEILRETMVLVGSLFIIILMAMVLTGYMKLEQVPASATAWMKELVDTRMGFLLALNLLLLVVGCLMDIFSAIVVVAPLVVPIALAYGVNPIHLGILFVVNLEIGFATPPFGINLFISSGFFRWPVSKVFLATLPFLVVLLLNLALLTTWEDLSLLLLRFANP